MLKRSETLPYNTAGKNPVPETAQNSRLLSRPEGSKRMNGNRLLELEVELADDVGAVPRVLPVAG